MWHAFLSWFLHYTGSNNMSGPWYGFWSGFGSDMGEVVLIGGLFSVYRKHNCHVRHCWRLSWRQVEGTTYMVCRKHHPRRAPTAEEVNKEGKAS